MNIVQLDQQIKAVCPIHGVSIGDRADKATWRIDFADEATEQQRVDAETLVRAFDVEAAELAEMKEGILAQVRALRENVLNRLTGIATRALISADSATASACATAQQGLLDLTTAAGVAEAEDEGALKDALVTAYTAIVVATPANIRDAFRDFDL